MDFSVCNGSGGYSAVFDQFMLGGFLGEKMALSHVFLRVLRFFPVVLLLYLGQAGEAGEPSNKTVLRWMSENI